MESDALFSVSALSVWDLYPWAVFGLFYLIATLLFLFPRIGRIWPFSSFLLALRGTRLGGVVTLVLVSIIAVPHYHMTSHALRAEQQALLAGNYESIAVCGASRPISEPELLPSAERMMDQTRIKVSGRTLSPPGGLHGYPLREEIWRSIESEPAVALFVHSETVLEVRRLDACPS